MTDFLDPPPMKAKTSLPLSSLGSLIALLMQGAVHAQTTLAGVVVGGQMNTNLISEMNSLGSNAVAAVPEPTNCLLFGVSALLLIAVIRTWKT